MVKKIMIDGTTMLTTDRSVGLSRFGTTPGGGAAAGVLDRSIST
jgi:hypothetical protein